MSGSRDAWGRSSTRSGRRFRIALGATSARIGGLVLRQALWIAVGGATLGLAGAWIAVRLLTHLLYGVHPVDVSVFVTAALSVCLAAILASMVPMWRASRADPTTTLRSD